MNHLYLLLQILASRFVQTPKPTIQFVILLLTVFILFASTQLGFACTLGTPGCGGG